MRGRCHTEKINWLKARTQTEKNAITERSGMHIVRNRIIIIMNLMVRSAGVSVQRKTGCSQFFFRNGVTC